MFSIHELAKSWLTSSASNWIYSQSDTLTKLNRTCNSQRYDNRLNWSKRCGWTGLDAVYMASESTRGSKYPKLFVVVVVVRSISFKDSAQNSYNEFHRTLSIRPAYLCIGELCVFHKQQQQKGSWKRKEIREHLSKHILKAICFHSKDESNSTHEKHFQFFFFVI